MLRVESVDYPLVLLVDEDAEFTAWVASMLALCGLKCVAAQGIAEAEAVIRQQQVGCVILSADLGAEYFRFGQGVAGHVKRPLPVAYVTSGEADEAAMLEAHYYGGVYLIRKPVAASQLLAWVGSLLVINHRVKGLLRLIERLEEQATTDPLTGLFNRRLFYRRQDEELARATRAGDDIALIYMDIDHFKQVNDNHGHNAGDEVLKQVAGIISSTLRKSDVVGRIGGEEFVILLPGTAPKYALMISERLRRLVEGNVFKLPAGTLNATVSAGLCCARHPWQLAPQEFVDKADQALYTAKESGRNRVVQTIFSTAQDGEGAQGQS
jgi:diguanylate cyclase (GGDEF)-like protein